MHLVSGFSGLPGLGVTSYWVRIHLLIDLISSEWSINSAIVVDLGPIVEGICDSQDF
jgi:hypothetical protein